MKSSFGDQDIAVQILSEWMQWYVERGPFGVPQRIFSGVDVRGRHFTLRLDSLPLEHVKRRCFLIWMCRQRGFIAYWPAAGSVDTELRCLMELEVSNGETEVQPRVQT